MNEVLICLTRDLKDLSSDAQHQPLLLLKEISVTSSRFSIFELFCSLIYYRIQTVLFLYYKSLLDSVQKRNSNDIRLNPHENWSDFVPINYNSGQNKYTYSQYKRLVKMIYLLTKVEFINKF